MFSRRTLRALANEADGGGIFGVLQEGEYRDANRLPEPGWDSISNELRQRLPRSCHVSADKLEGIRKALEPGCFVRCQAATFLGVNETAPPWRKETSRYRPGRLLPVQSTIHSGVRVASLMAGRPDAIGQIVLVLIE